MEILREAILVVKVSYPTDNNHILIVREEAHVQNLDLGQMLAPFIYVSYIQYILYTYMYPIYCYLLSINTEQNWLYRIPPPPIFPYGVYVSIEIRDIKGGDADNCFAGNSLR